MLRMDATYSNAKSSSWFATKRIMSIVVTKRMEYSESCVMVNVTSRWHNLDYTWSYRYGLGHHMPVSVWGQVSCRNERLVSDNIPMDICWLIVRQQKRQIEVHVYCADDSTFTRPTHIQRCTQGHLRVRVSDQMSHVASDAAAAVYMRWHHQRHRHYRFILNRSPDKKPTTRCGIVRMETDGQRH